MLRLMAQCGDNKRNECRNLHFLIHRTGKTFPVPVDRVTARVRVLSGKPSICDVNYPVLHMSSWTHAIFKTGNANILLAGHSLLQDCSYREVFEEFWQRFRNVRPDLELFQEAGADLGTCIPIGIHGDEGRGRLKRAVMILSLQPLVGHQGPAVTNASGTLHPG